MSIKVYNEVTGEWEVRATNQAELVEIEDVTGELDTEDVEGALTTIVDKLEDVEVKIYEAEKQLDRIDKKATAVIEEFSYHLENHPSGGGGQDGVMPTITSTFEDNTVVDKETKLYIPIFFSSGNLGNGTAYIIINGIEIGSQSVKQGSNNVEVGLMPSQLNTVSIYVKDRGGLLSNQLSWTVICGGIEVSTTFDFEADYPMGETLIMPFNITTQSTDKIIMYLTVDQDIYMLDCVNGYNEYKFKELGVGIHKISFYVESGKYLTETYSYNLVIVDSNNLYVSTTFENGQEIAFGKLISINYRVSKASTENFTINLYMDGILEKSQTAPAGSYYWTITRLPIGEHTFKIEATGVQGDYAFIESTFTVVEGVYTPLEPVTGGLLAYFTAKNKTNQDDNKEIWTDESGNGVVATLHNFNYGNNGWMGDYLQCSGDAYVEIELQPYLDNVKQGSTIDIHFNQTSVGVEDARVLDYTEIETPNKGIYINTMETKLVSETSTGLVKLDENTDTRLTYVIDRQNRLAIIYLNGVINRVFPLSDTGTGVNATFENFSHKEKIYLNSRKGQDLFADCKIYSLRVYNRALSHEEVLQNHIADISDLNEQEKLYNKNYANYDIPEIRMYGDTTNMTGEIFQTMRIKYTSPNEDLYGQSFDTMYNQVRWQGTSSQQYDMKNYQVYLKDNNMADMYYTPFANGIPEHIFCFKCNYMESSHMNNTGIATFANDCVFTTPNPAQAKNPQVRNSINGFPCLLYINDELEGVYTFNLDRYSTNSLGYDTTQFPKCLSYEISANSDTTAGAFVPWSISTGKTEREYLSADFKCRYPDNRVNGDDDFAELKRLVDWVGNATDDMFREQIEQYFNLEYLIRYYLTVQLFGLIDNLGKNTMLTTFDGNVWYMQLYDCDSCTGLDNSGAMKFDPDIEVEVGVFNTSNSRLWDKLRRNFPTQILAQWETLRLNEFTEENIMKYLVDNISDKIPEINYNLDAWKKYIVLGKDMLFACHGNRRQQIQRWIKERIIYVDTLLNYTVSTNDYITVRVNKLGEVHFDIQTFQPMYFSIKFRNEENGTGTITKRINRGETVRFSYNIPVATDQEILVYGGRFIKDLGDLSEMNPTNLILGNATRLTKVKCTNADMLINASISECAMLQEVDLHGCSNLGAGSDASLQTLDLSACRNLRTVDISGTQLTALYTSQQGGIIQEILYPYSIQIVQVQNQARLTSLGIPCYYTGDYNDERNMFAERLSLMQVANCPNVKTFVKNYYTNEDGSEVPVPTFIGVSKGRTFNLSNVMGHLTQIDLSYCSNIESLTLDNFYNLTEINFDDIAPYNATTSNLYNLTLTNCPNVETLTFNQNTVDGENSLGVAFKEGTVLDLSGLYNLKHIRSNVGIKGLKKLILPLTISSLVFNYPASTTYAYGESDIEDIFSKNALHETDGFKGIDLLDIETITDFSMGSLTKINNAINLDVKITDTFPYINYFKTNNYFKPEGTIDISEYKGSLEYLFKGVDLDKLTVVCNEPLPHTSAKYMFAYASGENVEVLNTLFGYMPNVTDFSYMFYCGYLKHAPLIPTRAENVSYMFYNNATMETTPSNWLQAYPIIPISDYCYAGCSGIIMIDDNEGSIDVIPVAWGGFDRKNAVVSGETIIVEQTLEREFVNFTASGQTFQNIVPEVGQTPTLIANKSEQPVGEGMSDNILLVDGVMPEAELEGFTLANLASEKRSSKMTCNQTENDIKAGLNDTFIVEDGGVVSQLELDGLTLVNIMPETGKTPLISNNDGQFQINKGLDDGIILDNDKMLSAVIYGETLTNLAETIPAEPVTIGYKQNFIPNEYIEYPVVATEGKMLMFEGNTLKNILPENGNTPTLSTDGYSIVPTDYNLDSRILVKDGEVASSVLYGKTLSNLVPELSLAPTVETQVGERWHSVGRHFRDTVNDEYQVNRTMLERDMSANATNGVTFGLTAHGLESQSLGISDSLTQTEDAFVRFHLRHLEPNTEYKLSFDVTHRNNQSLGHKIPMDVNTTPLFIFVTNRTEKYRELPDANSLKVFGNEVTFTTPSTATVMYFHLGYDYIRKGTTTNNTIVLHNIRIVKTSDKRIDTKVKDGEMAKAVLQGRTLNNLANASIEGQRSGAYTRTFDENTGIVTMTFGDNASNFEFGYGVSLIDINKLKPSTQYTFVVNILQNTIDYTNTNAKFVVYSANSYIGLDKRPFLGEFVITENKGGVKKFVFTTNDDLSQVENVLGMTIKAYNATVQYQLMIFEGDLTNEDFLEYKWFPTGFGSVSSPTVTMTTANCININKFFSAENVDYSSTAKYYEGQSTRAIGAKYPLKANTIYYASCNDCDVSHWLGQYKRFSISPYNSLTSAEYTTAVGNRNVHQGFGQLAWEVIKLKEGQTTSPSLNSMSYDWRGHTAADIPDGYCETVDIAPTALRTDDQGLLSMYSYFSYPNTLNGATNAVNHGKKLYPNICFSEIERRNVPYQETVIETPSNLVLRSRVRPNGTRYKPDTLDLKTGTVTRNTYQFDFDREDLLTETFYFVNQIASRSGYYWITTFKYEPIVPDTNCPVCSNPNIPVTTNYNVNYEFFKGTGDVAVVLDSTLSIPNIDIRTNNMVAIGIRQDLLSDVVSTPKANSALTTAQKQKIYEVLANYKKFSVVFGLKTPVTEQIDLSSQPQPYFYEHGNIHFNSTQVLPTMKYQPQSSNTTTLHAYKDKQYTLFTTSKVNNQTFTVDNNSFLTLTQRPTLFTASGDSNVLKYRGELEDMVVLSGDHTRTPALPYFTGTKHVENGVIRTVKNENLFNVDNFDKDFVVNPKVTSLGLLGGFEPNTQYSVSWDYLVAPKGYYTWYSVFLNEDGYNENKFGASNSIIAIDNRNGSSDVVNRGQINYFVYHTVTSDSKGRIGFGCYFGWTSSNLALFKQVAKTLQIKKGANNYLPYIQHESTITSLPSEVVLRGISDDMCDTLDLLTGQLTTNIEVMTPEQIVAFTHLTTINDKTVNPKTKKAYVIFYYRVAHFVNTNLKSPKPDDGTSGKPYVMASNYFTASPYVAANEERTVCPLIHVTKDGGIVASCRYEDLGYLDSETPTFAQLAERYKQFIMDNNISFYYMLGEPVVSEVDLSGMNLPYTYKDGTINVSSSYAVPTLKYQPLSCNNFENVSELSDSTQFTLRYKGNATSLQIRGRNINSPTNNSLVTSGASSNPSNLLLIGEDIHDVMLFKGDVREQEINYFTGLATVEVNSVLFKNELFDKNAPTEKKYLDAQGELVEGKIRTINQTIYVNNNTGLKITYSQFQFKSGTYPYIRIGEFRENGTFIKRSLISSADNNTYNDTVTFDVNTHYIILSIDNDYDYAGAPIRFDDLSIRFANKIGQIDLPQPIQLNKLSDTVYDTYNIITGEYVQRVGKVTLTGDNYNYTNFYVRDANIETTITVTPSNKGARGETLSDRLIYDWNLFTNGRLFSYRTSVNNNIMNVVLVLPRYLSTKELVNQWFRENNTTIYYQLEEPITTYLEPLNINCNTEEQVTILTETNTVFPKTTINISPTNKYDTTNWIPNAPITFRNATSVFVNGSTTPTAAREVMSFTEEQLSSGSIVINDNGNGLIILNGDYTGRDIPYFTGMRSVEAIEIETTPSSDQPLFGKGGRR